MGLLNSDVEGSVNDAVAETKDNAEEFEGDIRDDESKLEEVLNRVSKLEYMMGQIDKSGESEIDDNELTERIESVEKEISDLKAYTGSLPNLDEINRLLKRVEEDSSEIDYRLSDLEDSLNQEIRDEGIATEGDLADLRNKLEDFEDQREDLERLRAMVEDVDRSISRINRELKDAEIEEKVDKSYFERKIEQLRGDQLVELSRLRERIEELSEDQAVDNAELEQELEKARDEMAIQFMGDLQEARVRMASKSEIRSLWDSLEMVDESQEENAEEIESLEREVTELISDFSEISGRIEGLEKEIQEVGGSEERLDREEVYERLESLEEAVADTEDEKGVETSEAVTREEFDDLQEKVQRLSEALVKVANNK